MTQQSVRPESFWDRVLVVIPTMSGSQAANVMALDEQFSSMGAQVVVVANGRSALTALDAHGAAVVTLHRNLGFAAAVNRGRESRAADFDWVLLVNDDVAVTSLEPFEILTEYASRAAIVTFGPEPSRPIPGVGGTFAALAMIPLGRVRSRDAIGAPFPLPAGRYTPFSIAAIQRNLWDDLDGLDERFPFMYEDADFARRAELAGATRIAVHLPDNVSHSRGVSGRSNVRAVFPTVTWSAFQYLQKWGLKAPLARLVCTVALLLRVPLLPFSRVPVREHFLALISAMGVAVGIRHASLPKFEDA
jgi:GT2 family glycosyltransferase